jgi:hypothetical protein
MKKGWMIGIFLIFVLSFVSAESCDLDVTLLNQDPYPAIPGESVKVVFQIDGVSNPECNTVHFEVKENFPFVIDQSSQNPITIVSGAYLAKYSSFYLAPYKIRIDKDSLEGDIPIEVLYSSNGQQQISLYKEFNINVKDVKADFEVYLKDYNAATNSFTLEILNIAESDVEALTIEILEQDNVEIKGANRVVVGSLDSNEYTTADFEGLLKEGNINLRILYTDLINERREVTETIYINPLNFNGLNKNKTSQPIWLYILILLAIVFIVWKVIKNRKGKSHRHS